LGRLSFGIGFTHYIALPRPALVTAHCGSTVWTRPLRLATATDLGDLEQSDMAIGNGPDHHLKETGNTDSASFPELSSEEPYAHAGQQYREQAEARFASLGLLAVANGQPHANVRAIVDVDLADVPALPVGHRDYERRMETRTKIKAQNQANEERRFTIQMDAWTKVYAYLKQSTERHAPVLSRQIMNLCDLEKTRNLPGGYFDGPRA
jgi:hypothetical protein